MASPSERLEQCLMSANDRDDFYMEGRKGIDQTIEAHNHLEDAWHEYMTEELDDFCPTRKNSVFLEQV